MLRLICLFSFSLCFLFSCQTQDKSEDKKTLFSKMDGEKIGISFVNAVKDQKDFNIMSYRNFYNGGGVAIGDINSDGLADIYFTSNMKENKLYLNKGDWKFEDITERAGVAGTKMWSTGVTMADINGDGLLDIYVCNSGDLKGDNKENELFINNGDGTFTERAEEFGLNNKGYSTHASFFDYDMDGDLDCYLLNNSFKSISRVDQYKISRTERIEEGDKLLRNDDGYFKDVSEEAGIYSSWIGFGLGVSVSDLNGDMYPDIYVSNDFWERDYLYLNNRDGTFSEELVPRTNVISGSSMGSDVADLNNDGHADVFTTEMLPPDNHRIKTMTKFQESNIEELRVRSSYHYQLMQNSLHYNDGDANFQELAFLTNTAATDWSWGALLFDMNNDGWKDIFVSNGIYHDITSMDFTDFVSDKENLRKHITKHGKFDVEDMLSYMPSTKVSNFAFINEESKRFSDQSIDVGLSEPSFSNGAAYGDLDNDGDMDLVVNNLNMESFVYRNNGETLFSNNYLKIKFKGQGKNPFGIGSLVTLYNDGMQQVAQNFQARGFESSVEPQLLFGLGKYDKIDSIIVVWPDLKQQTLLNVKVNQTLSVDIADADVPYKFEEKSVQPLYSEVGNALIKGNIRHRENEFSDFDHERLMPRKVSTEGPKIINGDFNGDDLEDFLLLGAFGDPDKLFFQKRGGDFQEQIQKTFLNDSLYEGTCGVAIDLDLDGDLDLLVGSGGNEFRRGPEAYVLRYYENDGKGNFTRNLANAPTSIGNFSTIIAEDFDRDGDEDLFIGGRIVPGNYGLIPKSYLFRNDNGVWIDLTPASLAGAGMVTDAVWSDYDGDGWKDLFVVGEWMPVLIFRNTGYSLEESYALQGTEGWWNTIEVDDLNNDGTEDFVLGNWGLNSKFKATSEKPLTMFVNDFDRNRKSEAIINWYPPADTIAYPFASKIDMTSQLPFLKKNALRYEDYAKKTYEDLFTSEQKEGANEYKTTILESSIIWNNGDKGFVIEPLPLEAQVSPVFSILIEDIDGDTFEDILLYGNLYGLKPEVGRLDSSIGTLLKGDGCGEFVPASIKEVGLMVKGEVRDIKIIDVDNELKTLLIARNNDSVILYQKIENTSDSKREIASK